MKYLFHISIAMLLLAALCFSPVANGQDRRIVAQLREFVEQKVEEDTFSGVVLLAKNGEPVFRQAYGKASFRFHVENNLETRFNVGSMGKMFTALAIGQLREQEKLHYSDLVGKHLPDYPNTAVAESVSLHHLLTHTAGMGNHFSYNDIFKTSSLLRWQEVDDYLPLYLDETLHFTPGEKWQYSNSGYLLLGKIIEAASNENYFNYIDKNIFAAAKMRNTGFYRMDEDVPNLAIGYTRRNINQPTQARRNNLYVKALRGSPAGGSYSTADDLLNFAKALRDNVLVSEATTAMITSGKLWTHPGYPEVGKYAYGFRDYSINGHRIIGHPGGIDGVSSQLEIYLDIPYTLIVLSNYDPPIAWEISVKVRELLTAN